MTSDSLRNRVPDTIPDDVELFEQDEQVFGRDEHGEFRLAPEMRGMAKPQDERCNAVLVYTQDRYGETRYCGKLPEATFIEDGSQDHCKTHKSRDSLMERAHELFEHGYFATNYVNFVQKLPADKFIFAVEMFRGLIEQSTHEFDIANEVRVVDTSESAIIAEDEVAVGLAMPKNEKFAFQANELWTAALKEVQVQNMQEAVFEEGMAKRTLADSADMEGSITDTVYEQTEHHLHLPISRLAKDIKEHLKNGGVAVDDDDGAAVTFQQNDYTLDVAPDESASGDAENVSEVSEDFHEKLATDEEATEVEVE